MNPYKPPGQAKGGYQAAPGSPASAGSASPAAGAPPNTSGLQAPSSGSGYLPGPANTGGVSSPVNTNGSNAAEWDYALGGRSYGAPAGMGTGMGSIKSPTDQVGSASNPNAPVVTPYNSPPHWGSALQDSYMAAANQYRQQLTGMPPPNTTGLQGPKTPILTAPSMSTPYQANTAVGDGQAVAMANPTTDGKAGGAMPMQTQAAADPVQSFVPAAQNTAYTPNTASLAAPASAPSAYQLPTVPAQSGSSAPSQNVVNAMMKRFNPTLWR